MNYSWNKNSIPILQLGADFYDESVPAPFPESKLRYWNESLALKIEKISLWNFKPLPHNLAKPLALRYHGHQFQHYNPQIGDGRGFLFAQLQINNQWFDLGTKGSGQTVYSRSGDGRLTLKGAVREALATEMLESLGVNTSKTVCIFETSEQLQRGDEPSPTRSAVMTRFSRGHIRIGTFQRLAYFKETENIKKLVSYCLHFYFPEHFDTINFKDDLNVLTTFLQLVRSRQAKLAAEIMMAGFVHGVLNTDNINISGELFDYGPYRFLPNYDPNFVAAYFDHQGLYAFGRQPHTLLWNLHQLGTALQTAHPEFDFGVILEPFGDEFNAAVQLQFLKRLNLHSNDINLVADTVSLYFKFMDQNKIPFEQMFFDFFGCSEKRLQASPFNQSYSGEHFLKLLNNLLKMKIVDPSLNAHNYFSTATPQTLLIDEIELIWSAIDLTDDWSLFERKLQSLRAFRGIY